MKSIFYILSFIFILTSCICESRGEYEYKKMIVKDKTIDLLDGTTSYNVAFENGESEYFSFGLYSKYEPGDTVYFSRESGWFWKVVDKNQWKK